MTAEDVAFTIRSLQDVRCDSPQRSRLLPIERVEVIDAATVAITFESKVEDPRELLTFKILPQHKFPPGPPICFNDAFDRQPIGSGPYRFVRWSERGITLEEVNRSPRSISRIEVRFIPDKIVQLDFLQYEAIHAVPVISWAHRALVAAMAPKVRLVRCGEGAWWYLRVYRENIDLKLAPVRLAIAHAIDRDEILAATFGGGNVQTARRYDFDPERSRAFLASAGYVLREGRYRLGDRPLVLRLAETRAMVDLEVALALQRQLGAVGIELVIGSKYDSDLALEVSDDFEQGDIASQMVASVPLWRLDGYAAISTQIDATIDPERCFTAFERWRWK